MDTAWQQVKWRPVVSYSNHYLKHLLGMAGRWATFVTIALGLGDYADDPREVTEDVHRYKDSERMRRGGEGYGGTRTRRGGGRSCLLGGGCI